MTIHLTANERPLSPSEYVVWATDAACPLNFAMHFELRGILMEDQLRHALQHVQDRHPLLRMRMVDEGPQAWFRSGGVGPLPLRIVVGPVERLVEEAEHEVQAHFDCRKGPLARCVWIRHTPEHGTLLVTLHHAIGDGTSGALLIRDLLRALADEKLTPLPLAESLDSHLPPMTRGLRGFLGYLRTMACNIGWTLHKGKPRTLPVELPAPITEQRARLLLMRFDAAFLEALTARARAERTTVHGALSAAIVLAGFPELQADKAHIMFCSPINLRDRLTPPIGDDVGLFITGAYSSHAIHSQREFWELARELKQELTAGIESGRPFFGLNGLAPALLLRHRLAGGGVEGMRAIARGLAAVMQDSFGLTNIGRAKIEQRYGEFEVSAVGFVASPSVVGSNVFFAAAHGGILTLNYAVMEPVVSPATQRRVAERTRALLEAAVASS